MELELCCTTCCHHFSAPHEYADDDGVFDAMFDRGPGYALGDGETFEDMLHAMLNERGEIHCPECGSAVEVSEENLGQLALDMLTRM